MSLLFIRSLGVGGSPTMFIAFFEELQSDVGKGSYFLIQCTPINLTFNSISFPVECQLLEFQFCKFIPRSRS